jgi:hypothetical protein
VVGATLLGTWSSEAGAVTEDQRWAVQTAARLRPWLNASEAQSIAAVLSLPAEAALSVTLAEQLAPGWQGLRQRLKKLQVTELDRQGPAHRAWRRLDGFARQVKRTMPPVLAGAARPDSLLYESADGPSR